MKIFHYVNFTLIFLFLVAICIIENSVVNNSLMQTQDDCYKIEQQLQDVETLNTMDMSLLVDNLEYHWNKNENNLCYMVNHKSIQEIGTEISKIKMYVATNDVDALKVSIESIKYYCHSYLHFMGANVHNIL